MTEWLNIEQQVRRVLANAKAASSHVAWLDAMADMPKDAIIYALEEIERLRGVIDTMAVTPRRPPTP